jgi:hypothetical protein
MENIIEKTTVLKLNKSWKVVGQSTVGRAIVDLAAGLSAYAVDMDYNRDENGNPIGDAVFMRPVDWAEWLTLPVRPGDFAVHYGNGFKVMRAPTVLIAKNYNKMPKKTFKGKPSKDGVRIRDGNTCQYTGKKLAKDDITIDHVRPKSRGGGDTWENLAVTSKEINSKKGNKLNSEAGLKLIRKPKTPEPMPMCKLIKEARHPDWNAFLDKDSE